MFLDFTYFWFESPEQLTLQYPKVSKGFHKGFHMSFVRKCSATRSLFQNLWHKYITRGWICTFTSNPTRFWIFCEWLSSTISFVDVIKICCSYALTYSCLIDSRHISRNLGRNLEESLEKSWRNLEKFSATWVLLYWEVLQHAAWITNCCK